MPSRTKEILSRNINEPTILCHSFHQFVLRDRAVKFECLYAVRAKIEIPKVARIAMIVKFWGVPTTFIAMYPIS